MSVDKLSDGDILQMLSEKDMENASRNAAYEETDAVLLENKFSTKLDSTLDDQIPKSERQNLFFNFAWAKVSDKMALLNQIPDIKVPVPPDSGEDGEFQAEFDNYYYQNIWYYSNLPMLMQYNGYCLGGYGTCIWMAEPDFNAKRMRITTRHPKALSYQLKSGSNHEYNWVAFNYELTGRQVLDTYPSAKELENISYDASKYKIRELWTPDQKLYFIEGGDGGSKELKQRVPGLGVEHKLGFIPIRITPNRVLPGQAEGMSDVMHNFAAQDNANEILNLYTQQLRSSINPMIELMKAVNLPENIAIGDGAVIEVEEGGGVRPVPRVSAGFDVSQHLGQIQQTLREMMNFPPTRSGFPAGSGTVTGKGQMASMSSVTSDIDSLNRTVGNDLVIVDGYCKKMDKRFFPKVKQHMYTAYSKTKGKEGDFYWYFPEDLSDYAEHQLIFYPMGYDANVDAIKWYQAHGQKAISLRTLREKLPGINPDEEERRIETEQQKEMELMAAQQAMMNPEQAPPGQAEDEAFAMEQGAMPEPPPGMLEGV